MNLLSGGFFHSLRPVGIHADLRRAARPDGARDFWASRFARLYPLYFVAWLGNVPGRLPDQAARHVRAAAGSERGANTRARTIVDPQHDPGRELELARVVDVRRALFWSLFPLLYPLVGRIQRKGRS